MSVRRCQHEVSSPEFAEWMAFYRMVDEAADPNREPTQEELGAKIEAWARMQGAGRPRQVIQERR